jgi:hypothetical protein
MLAVLMAVLCGPYIGVIAPAHAGVGFGAVPTFSSPVQVGLTGVPASLTIQNIATPPDSMDPVTIQPVAGGGPNAITLVPSCGSPFPSGTGNCATPDPGVLGLSAGGVGEAGTACADTNFTITVVDAPTGKVAFAPSSPVVLQPPGDPADTCRINFTFDVLKSPTVDSQPAFAGLQTTQLGYVSGVNVVTNNLGFGIGASSVTVLQGLARLTTEVSPSTVVMGGSVTDSATVTGEVAGPTPTGTVDFRAFGPDDVACAGAPVFTSLNRPLSGGGATSAPFSPLQSGTHRFVASYSGDANYQPATGVCNEPGESVVVIAGQKPPADFDGNGTTDISVYRPGSSAAWYIQGQTGAYWGTTGDIPVPGDYDGNGTSDIAVFRPGPSAAWFISGQVGSSFGSTGDIPVPGDYDGNGTTDIAVFRPSQGAWYIQGQTGAYWGTTGDIPVPGDYDGNGTTDIAVFRPGATAAWYIQGQTSSYWGATGDIPVPGDYDGNGTTDLAVYRPGATGAWFIQGQTGRYFGTTGDIPVPGRYDTGATTDIAVYRPGANAAWFISGQAGASYGTTDDVPLPLPYAIRSVFFP